jgi:arabinan endo-1,5-alpha-L-arabinosidase
LREVNNVTTYYRFSKSNTTGSGLTLATAPSLRGPWKLDTFSGGILAGPLVDPTGESRNLTHLWAPDVHFFGETYYIFYSIFDSEAGNGTDGAGFDIAVATSPSMDDGTWTDHGSIGIPSFKKKEYVACDIFVLFNTSTNTANIVWGSFRSALFGMQLDPTSKFLSVSQKPAPLPIIQDQPIPFTSAGYQPNSNLTEGPFQWQQGDWVYLFYQEGHCCNPVKTNGTEYRTKVCRAPAATPQGPYFDANNEPCEGVLNNAGTLVLASHSNNAVWSPGSIGILNDPVEGLVMYYQYENYSTGTTHPGLRFGFNWLEFQNEWPVLVDVRNATSSGTVTPSAPTKVSVGGRLTLPPLNVSIFGLGLYVGVFALL